MPILGITGGIATGKSSFAALLSRRVHASLFDADQCARELLRDDQEVYHKVRDTFGEAAIADTGDAIDRAKLREIVFADQGKRRALEQILHPVIRTRWQSLAETARNANEWLLVDIPLLYETAAESHFDRIIVVACHPSTQMRRLLQERKLETPMARQIISAQMDLSVKITKADHLVWNDGSQASLELQANLLADYLRQRHE